MYTGIIYCAVCLINNKKYYGQTIHSLEKRKARHKKDLLNGCNFIFHQALRKHNWENFEWQIIEKHSTKNKKELISKLNERELFYIKKDKTYFREFGYNMTFGGDNYVHSRKPLKQDTKEKIRNALIGFKHTEERRKNQSNAHKGKSFFAKNFGPPKYGIDHPNYKNPTKEEIEYIIDLHVNKYLNCAKITDKYLNCAKITEIFKLKYSGHIIIRVLRENNVYTDTLTLRKMSIIKSLDVIIDLYVNKKMSIKNIAKLLNFNKGAHTIKKILMENNIIIK